MLSLFLDIIQMSGKSNSIEWPKMTCGYMTYNMNVEIEE